MPLLPHRDKHYTAVPVKVQLPWAVIAPHAEQALKNHSQSLERLAERGGLSCCEAAAILEDRRWAAISWNNTGETGPRNGEYPNEVYLTTLIRKLSDKAV